MHNYHGYDLDALLVDPFFEERPTVLVFLQRLIKFCGEHPHKTEFRVREINEATRLSIGHIRRFLTELDEHEYISAKFDYGETSTRKTWKVHLKPTLPETKVYPHKIEATTEPPTHAYDLPQTIIREYQEGYQDAEIVVSIRIDKKQAHH